MLRKSLIVFVISVFLFSALTLTEAYASKNHEPSATGIEVYDADGQYLGLSQGLSRRNVVDVYVPSLSSFVSISIWTGTVASSHNFLHFLSNNCTGTPYISIGGSSSYHFIGKAGEKLYTGAKTAPVEIEANSLFGVFNSKWECRPYNYPYSSTGVPAEEVTDLLPFTLPVALPLEFK